MKELITPDNIISVGLVLSLIAAIFTGADTNLQTNIAVGLVGYLGGKRTLAKAGDSK